MRASSVVQEQASNVAALDDALQRLEILDERQGKIVELRFCKGCVDRLAQNIAFE